MTQLQKWTVTIVVVIVYGGIVDAAPAPQFQPLSAQFAPEARGYAPGYGYDGVQQGPVAIQVGTAVSKTVHYADAPTVVDYAPSVVYKPDLSAYAAAPFPQVEQLHRFNPVVRPVHTVVPKVTAVEPTVTVQKTYVDVPVVHEYRTAAVPAVQVVQDGSPYYNYQLIDRK